MRSTDRIPTDPEHEAWDVIVVGCGMGGGTLGYELARLGRRVLYVEKGRLHHGDPAGAGVPDPALDVRIDDRLRRGRWPMHLDAETTFGRTSLDAPLGCGSAGSTALFGAQLERFRASDFRPREAYREVRDANLPEEWPISLEELTPYYRRVEAMFGVCGTPDPLAPDPVAELRAPPAMSARYQAIFDALHDLGLHPYRSHVAFAYAPGCTECNEICPSGCKSDAGNTCVVPALLKHDASILPQCEVRDVLVDGRRVTGVRARWNDADVTLRAKVIALGAGSWMTPRLLLDSRCAEFPDGLANRSGAVGRNLMLHASDFVAVDPGDWYAYEGPTKAVTLNDFYADGGRKLGSLQSVGLHLTPDNLELFVRGATQRDPAAWAHFSSRFNERAARIGAYLVRRASLMATIVEDLPYPDNRVIVDRTTPNGMRFHYRYPEELRERTRHFRRRVAEVLAPRLKVHTMPRVENNINYGHVCGTCRFGNDPATSVLDRYNRAHDLDNLYVVDASFFPSSGGINPSLTIAANALRVAGAINQQL